ncbi:hypothetical protein [Motilimonas eburnea]|uniref:hypothetical protein n=1 Tax=Motilimonas eburnea TaxID=1737488 RepID=UPI001E424B68|nr:hypothetical protein [Motilimonas eburnea]MCE2570701.1 hypothetical protein [Motilimonas eburnea]
MVYIWRNPNVSASLVGELMGDLEFGAFQKAKEVSSDLVPVFKFNCKLNKLNGLCELANNKRVPLVNKAIRDLLSGHCSHIQFLESIVQCKDGIAKDYFVVNVLSFVDALDKRDSVFDFVPGTEAIMRFEKIKYNDGDFMIAREVNYRVHLLVNGILARMLKEHGCKGLFLPEECI